MSRRHRGCPRSSAAGSSAVDPVQYAGDVNDVDAEVDDTPAAGLCRVGEPRLVRPVGVVEDQFGRVDLTERAAGDDVPDPGYGGKVPVGQVDAQQAVGLTCGIDHLLAL